MKKDSETLSVAISLDIDPDANCAVKGRYDALSPPVELGVVCGDACKKGLLKIFELLDAYSLDATLFYEARTAQELVIGGVDLPYLSARHEVACHSLKHEDFLGVVSGVPMGEGVIVETVEKAKTILEKIFVREIKGFRAPYTRINRLVMKALEQLGFAYDSSETMPLGAEWQGKPYPSTAFDSNLLELALPSFKDSNGKKMTSYLWAIFEGKRVSREYIDAVLWARDVAKGGLFIFSMHPWHLYTNYQGIPFSRERVRENIKNLEDVFSQLKQMKGINLIRQDRYLEDWLGDNLQGL